MDVEAAPDTEITAPDGAGGKMAALQVIRYSLASLLSHRQAAPAQRPPSFANARLSCILAPVPAAPRPAAATAVKLDGADSPLSCSSSGSSNTNSRRGKSGE